MKYILCLLLLQPFHVLFGQETYSFTEDFSWKGVETNDAAVIEKFLQLTPPEDFEYYTEPEKLAKVLHTVDLNRDKLDDVVFEGQVTEDEGNVIIYLNQGSSFKKVFSKEQLILHMELKNGALSKLAVEDRGCCGEVIIRDQFYDVTLKSSGELTFKMLKSFEYLEDTEFPQTYWPATKKVAVKHDKYKVRWAPVIDDSTAHANDAGAGNTVGLMPAEGIALAMGEATDATGRVWYFVGVYPEYPLTATLFYEPKVGARSFRCGWISSRFAEIVK